jgi:hypothetical protein
MKHIQTPSHTFIAVKFETTGKVDRKPLDVVKKFNIVVTPIITLAGTAFHSNQNVINDDVTNIIPGINTVVK